MRIRIIRHYTVDIDGKTYRQDKYSVRHRTTWAAALDIIATHTGRRVRIQPGAYATVAIVFLS